MVDRDLGKIPENLRPIFEAATAHDSIRAVIELVKNSTLPEQKSLIDNPTFLTAAVSSLQGVDECRKTHTLEIIDAFTQEVRGTAKLQLSGWTPK